MKERVFRFRAVEKRIAASQPGFRVLDVGCGRGDNLRRLVRYGGRAFGIEPDLARAREAQSIAPAAVGVGEHLPLADSAVDAAMMLRSFNHLRDPKRAIAEAARVVKPGGRLIAVDNVVFGLCRREVLETAVNEAAALATQVVRGGRGGLGVDG